MDPINYNLHVQSPFESALQGYQAGAAIRNDQTAQQQQQLAIQQQQQQAKVIQSLVSNPDASADDYANAALLVPGMKDNFKQAWETKSTQQQQNDLGHVSQVFAALKSGQPDIAFQLLSNRAQALRNSGNDQDAQNADVMAKMVKEHPDFATSLIGMKLASIPGGDKVITNARTLAMTPADVRKAEADATTAEVTADNAPLSAQIQNRNLLSQISERADRLDLDRDKLTSDVQMKLAELGQKTGELPEYVSKAVTDATTDSIASDQSAGRMLDLASKIDQNAAALGSGVTAKAGEIWKRAFGDQNELTRIRSEYNRIVTPAAMAAYKKVASGSTSDKDIETAMTGVPADTSDPATMASFLRGAAKLQVYDSVINNAKAEWLGSVKHLGKTKTDIEIDGVKVPAGTTFKQFTDEYVPKKVTEQLGAKSLEQVKSRPYMRWATPDQSVTPNGLGSGTFGIQQGQ